MSRKLLAVLAIILGLVLVAVALVYFVTPAASLPGFLPGYDPALSTVHYKHGLGALILGLGCFCLAWFQSKEKKG